MKRKRIKIPIYFGSLIMYKDKDLKEIEKRYNLTDCSDCDALVIRDGSNFIMAFSDTVSPSIIAHEALHVVSDVFNRTGVVMDLANQEPQCYLLGWVVEQCHKFLEGVK